MTHQKLSAIKAIGAIESLIMRHEKERAYYIQMLEIIENYVLAREIVNQTGIQSCNEKSSIQMPTNSNMPGFSPLKNFELKPGALIDTNHLPPTFYDDH